MYECISFLDRMILLELKPILSNDFVIVLNNNVVLPTWRECSYKNASEYSFTNLRERESESVSYA